MDTRENRLLGIDVQRILRLADIYWKASGISMLLLNEEGDIIGEAGFRAVRDRLHIFYPELFDPYTKYAPRIGKLLINTPSRDHLDRNWLYSTILPFNVSGRSFYIVLGCFFLKDRYSRQEANRFAASVGLDRQRFKKAVDAIVEISADDLDNAIKFFREIMQISRSKDETLPEKKTPTALLEIDDKEELLSCLGFGSWELLLSPEGEVDNSAFSIEMEELIGSSEFDGKSFMELGRSELVSACDMIMPGQVSRMVIDVSISKPRRGWLEHTVLIRKNDDGSTFIRGISRDISQRKRRERELKKSKQRFFELADFLPETVYETDSSGRIVYMNRAGLRVFGIDQIELSEGIDHRILLVDHDRQRAEKNLRDTLRGEYCDPEEFLAIDGNGREFPVIIHASPIIENGVCAGSRGLIIDITQTKAAERAIEVSLEKYRVLFEIFPIGISMTDPEGNLIEVNPASEKILGISMDDHISRRHDSPEWNVIYPDGSPMNPDSFASVRALRENRMVEVYESGIIHDDGSITWINMKAAPIPLENFGVAIAFTDITERHLARKAVEVSENKWRSLAENAPDVIITTDKEGNIVYCNKPIGNIPVELLIGSSVFYWSLQTNEKEFRRCFESCARTKRPVKIESPGIGPNGSVYWYSIHIGPLVSDSEVTGFTMILSDITEQKEAIREKQEMEIKMLASSKLATLGEMATGMAHEINQPLNYISVFLQLLEEELEDGDLDFENTRRSLKNSLHAVGRITTIIDHLRVFGRAHSDDTGPVQLPALFENTLILFSEKLRRFGIKVEIDMPAELPPARANANKLEQVFVNLIQNAVDVLLKKDGEREIHIEINNTPDKIFIRISDNGAGMDETTLSRVFEPFFTTKEPGKGTGLGLSIVHGIIMDFGGTIGVESEMGKGSIFSIELPTGGEDERI